MIVHHDMLRGQSIVEILIAVGIGALLIIGAVPAIVASLATSQQTTVIQAQTEAANGLLTDAKAWAAGNWDSVLALATGSASQYYFLTSASPFTATSGAESITLGGLTFTRSFFLSDVYRDSNGNVTSTASGNNYDPSTKQLTVTVDGPASSTPPAVYSIYLTRNASNVFTQSNWAGGPGANGPLTIASSGFASSTSNVQYTSSSVSLVLSMQSGENALYVLGQPDFISSAASTSASGMNFPVNVAYDSANQRLFVPDGYNNRVLVFNVTPNTFASGEAASFVLGQSNFTSNGSTTSQTGMWTPQGVAYDSANQRLFVADAFNERVLIFNVASGTLTNGENASFVLGQPSFTIRTPSTTQSGMYNPLAVRYDSANQRLFVADTLNERVLTFAAASGTLANGENASAVLGQSGFTSRASSTSQNSMFSPEDIVYDSANQRLFEADTDNNRVLVFTNATSGSITNGESASYVLGQQNFTSSTAATTQDGLHHPTGLAYDSANNRLFVADAQNNRVLVFNVAPGVLANDENASIVLGQSSFTSNSSSTTQNGLYIPTGVEYDATNQRLFVADAYNNRVLVFNAKP